MLEMNYFLPIIAILLGISGRYFPFVDTRKEFRDRVLLRRESLRENLAVYLADVLEHIRSIQDTDDELRGQPDLIKRYTDEAWRTFDALTSIGRIAFWFRSGHLLLFFATIVAMFLLVGVLVLPGQEVLWRYATIGTIVSQVGAICLIYLFSGQLEKYE